METPGKTQDGKTGAAIRYRFYYEKYGAFTILQIHPNLANAVTQQIHWAKPQLNINTLLRDCTTQLYEAR